MSFCNTEIMCRIFYYVFYFTIFTLSFTVKLITLLDSSNKIFKRYYNFKFSHITITLYCFKHKKLKLTTTSLIHWVFSITQYDYCFTISHLMAIKPKSIRILPVLSMNHNMECRKNAIVTISIKDKKKNNQIPNTRSKL